VPALDAVGNKIEIHIDGGIRSGQDVIKALCLGAKAAFFMDAACRHRALIIHWGKLIYDGNPQRWLLAYNGLRPIRH
jgi:hypothetical protein